MGAYSNDDEQRTSRERWISDTHAAVRSYRELRREVPAEAVRTEPYAVPEITDYLNRMLLEIWGMVSPMSHALTIDTWTETLMTVPTPKDGGEVNVGPVQNRDDLEAASLAQQLDREGRPVVLADLSNHWSENAFMSFTVRGRDEWAGEFEQTEWLSLRLPVYACDRAFHALNKCLENLGWLPEASEPEVESEVLV